MKTLLYWFLLLTVSFTAAQEMPPLSNYEPTLYGAGNQNWMVSESDDHFIYVANNKGLLEYNGATWTLYETPNESIMRSVKVQDERIYTGCYMDFGFWTADDTGLLNYTSIVKQSGFKLKEDEQFWNIIVKNDYVLFQSLSHIYSYNVADASVTQITEQREINKFFEVGNSYYFQELGSGLFQVVNRKPELIGDSDFFLHVPIILMFEFESETYLVTQDASIYKFTNGAVELISTIQMDDKITVYSAALLSNDSLMLGTIANGVVSVNLNGTVNYTLNQGDGLLNNTCLYIYEDLSKNVWFALDNGISTINVESPYQIYSDRDGNLGTIYATHQIDDTLYIGTNQGLFYKKSTEDKLAFIEGTEGQVWSITEWNGTLFCNHHLGLFVVNDTSASRIENTIGTWQLNKIPKSEKLLLAGTYKGLSIISKVNDTWQFRNKIEGFDISSKDLVLDDNLIYVNHEYKGVFQLQMDRDFQKLQQLEVVETLGKGIGSHIVNFKGTIFFSKKNAIYVKKRSETIFVKDEELSSLVSSENYTSGTFIKDDGYLWLFNRNNINKINIEDINGSYSIEQIPLGHEIRKEKIGYESLTTIKPKKYLIGTSNGYVTIDQNLESKETHKVHINKLSSYEKNIQSSLNLKESPLIAYKNNHIRIDYSSPFYQTLSTIEYQYRLKEEDEEWSNWSKQKYVEFNNLPYGDYSFEVRSRVNTMVSGNTDSITFTVARPYYLTYIAILIYIVILILIILALNLGYMKYFKKQKERALQKQHKELELKNLTNEKNLVELRNAKLRSDIEHRNKELAISTMAMIKKNETLNELKEELNNLPKTAESKSLNKLLDKNLNSKQDWLTFEEAFNNADKDFFKKIKELHPSLTSGDLRLCVYLRLNLSSKEIAPLLNISPRSVEIKRYRLRKKLDLSREDSLTSYIVEI